MALVIYELVREEEADRSCGEEAELICWTDLPTVGDPVRMGSDRLWQVVALEPYHAEIGTVYLAMVAAMDHPVPDPATWSARLMRQYSPDLSFDVAFSPDKALLNYGWSMEGKPPVGSLYHYEPTTHETLVKPVARPWVVDRIDTYRPEGDATYTAVHVCWCVAEEMAIAA